ILPRSQLTLIECGAAFTHNLEQMFKDQELSKEHMKAHASWLSERGESQRDLDLTVNVLSSAAWPTYPDVPVNIPADVARYIDEYDRMYKGRHTGRRLTWKHQLGHCVVRAWFAKGIKELTMSAFQGIVLV